MDVSGARTRFWYSAEAGGTSDGSKCVYKIEIEFDEYIQIKIESIWYIMPLINDSNI
jgi:hypothetical protein